MSLNSARQRAACHRRSAAIERRTRFLRSVPLAIERLEPRLPRPPDHQWPVQLLEPLPGGGLLGLDPPEQARRGSLRVVTHWNAVVYHDWPLTGAGTKRNPLCRHGLPSDRKK